MISPSVQRFLCEHLQGQRSSDETREILRLIDDSRALEAEFDSVLSAVAQKIPGLALDFEKLLSGDEVECDPLISQGNLALLRLDAAYYQAFEAWKKSGGDLHRFRRITKAENPATYSDSTEKHERTDENYPPDAQLLNQVVNITLSGFRIQATITHRRDQLVSRDATRSTFSPQQTNDQSQITSHSSLGIIDHNESLADFDDFMEPTVNKLPLLIRGVNRISKLNGYNKIEPLTKTQPISPTVQEGIAPRVPCSDCGTPRSEHAEYTNNVSPEPREEEPVTSVLSANSTPPRETSRRFADRPLFHKRE